MSTEPGGGDVERERRFKFLDELRASGATNMFGSPLHLQEAFQLDYETARAVFVEWLGDVSDGHRKIGT